MSKFFGVLVFVIFCFSLSVSVLVTDSFFTTALLDRTSPEVAKDVSHHLWKFFAFQEPIPNVFTPNEASHLGDVRLLLWLNAFVTVLSAVLLTHFKNRLQVAKVGSIVLGSIIVVASLLPFDRLFLWFHYVFFPQGNFLFPPHSVLLAFYPSEFFALYSVGVALNAMATAGILLFLSYHTQN